MLVAHPSSLCDICYRPFSERLDCYSIPCGHVFCRECLERLTRMVCPMCRTPIGSMSRIRKVHVDMTKCLDQDPQTLRRLRKLEEKLISEALDSPNISFQSASELSAKIHKFLRKQPPTQHGILRSIEKILNSYASVTAIAYEESSNARAVKASYDDRIKQLEKQLKEKTTHNRILLQAEDTAHNHPESSRPTARHSHVPVSPVPAPKQESNKKRRPKH